MLIEDMRVSMGPLKSAAMNGLSASCASVLEPQVIDDTRAPKDERRKVLESKMDSGQDVVEFERIPKKSPNDDVSVASRPDNKERNRIKDVQPYDRNRVRLTPTKDNPTGYINASHVKMKVRDDIWWYLATQGPMADTVVDFWQMVWEQKVEVVAMLTRIEENGREKCKQYWPDNKGLKNRVKFGDYQVVLQFARSSEAYMTRGLQLKHMPTGEQRSIWHIQYTDWPDHGCPDDIKGFLSYLDEIESVRRHVRSEHESPAPLSTSPITPKVTSKPPPVIVHCSAGVGRTGVLILTEVMRACLQHNVNADIPSMLTQLRTQRMYMVQTMTQYSFVYKTLVQYLKNSRLI